MKFKRYLIILLLALVMVFFVACDKANNNDKGNDNKDQQGENKDKNPDEKNPDEKDPEPVHTHSYKVKSLDEKFKVEDATCTKGSVYYYSCECGEAGTEKFEANDAKGHKYEKGTSFYTNKEVLGVIVPENIVRVFFKCADCKEEVYIDYDVTGEHTHICHEGTFKGDGTHEATCAICGEKYTDACMHDDNNICIFCGNEKEVEYGDNLWKLEKTNGEVILQNDAKAYYYGKGEENYNDITVTVKKITYLKGTGCSIVTETVKFQYELETNNYYISQTDRTEIGTYGWFPVSFKINKCVDAVGQTYYYKFENGNIGVYFTCNGECTNDTYHEFNEQGQLLMYKLLQHVDENTEILTIYTYSYGKEW